MGKKFNRLTVIGTGYRRGDRPAVLCECECGNKHIVRRSFLISGAVKSCGCLQREITSKNKTKHGKTGTRLYSIWQGMKSRCKYEGSKIYKYYGGRGITYCKEWEKFEPFYKWAMENGYQNNLTLDRIDNDGDYEPDNCRWVTMDVQVKNSRHNKYYKIGDDVKCLSEWCDIFDRNYKTIQSRLTLGWDIEKALTVPTGTGFKGSI